MNINYDYQKRLIAKVGGTPAWDWDFTTERWSITTNHEVKSVNISYIRGWAKESGLPFNPDDWEDEHIFLFKLRFE